MKRTQTRLLNLLSAELDDNSLPHLQGGIDEPSVGLTNNPHDLVTPMALDKPYTDELDDF